MQEITAHAGSWVARLGEANVHLRGDVTAAWPAILKLIFSYEGTSEDLQEPDISDTTDLLLSDPEFTEVQLDLHPSCRGRL